MPISERAGLVADELARVGPADLEDDIGVLDGLHGGRDNDGARGLVFRIGNAGLDARPRLDDHIGTQSRYIS